MAGAEHKTHCIAQAQHAPLRPGVGPGGLGLNSNDSIALQKHADIGGDHDGQVRLNTCISTAKTTDGDWLSDLKQNEIMNVGQFTATTGRQTAEVSFRDGSPVIQQGDHTDNTCTSTAKVPILSHTTPNSVQ